MECTLRPISAKKASNTNYSVYINFLSAIVSQYFFGLDIAALIVVRHAVSLLTQTVLKKKHGTQGDLKIIEKSNLFNFIAIIWLLCGALKKIVWWVNH